MRNSEAIYKGNFRIKEVEAVMTLNALNDKLDAEGIPAKDILSVRYQPARPDVVGQSRPSFRVIYMQ